jgi:hypothetical protein
VDVPTLVLLGAAGGALRGVLDFYIQFVNWRSARSAHRRLPRGEAREAPQFQDYFDPAVDLVAALVHSGMGAALALLLGRAGQISGPFAAIVVGISAPVVLTQLARIEKVSEAVGGGTGTDVSSSDTAPPPWQPVLADSGDSVDPAASHGGPPSSTASTSASPNARQTVLRSAGEAAEPQSNGRPVDPTRQSVRGRGDLGASPLQPGPAIGEEGTP